jgi:DNA-binding winged helix-turn-helix (wHTH) protein
MTHAQPPLSPVRGTNSLGPLAFSFEYGDYMMVVDVHGRSRPAPTSLAFGPFRLFPRQRLLTNSGEPVHIGSRAFDILVALVERRGGLVSKQELIARAWPTTVVAQANLAVQIAGLRRALGDGGAINRYVMNIPGRGYRFVAPVTIDAGSPA